MVNETTVIDDLVSDNLDTIEAHETTRTAHRRMESQTLRSLIVVDGERPVGVVKWRDIRSADSDSPVSSFMTTDFPVLRRGMTIPDAHGHLGDVDFDNIPVVDDEGRLIGEVPRGAIVHHETSVNDADRIDVNGNPVVTDGPHFDLSTDMDVVDVEDSKLGTISEMSNDPTTHSLAHIMVEHGLLRKKHKRIPVDTINRVEDGKVFLGISKIEWDFLPDVEDQDV